MPGAAGRGGGNASASQILRSIVARMNSRLYKSTAGWMYETINPLWNINSRQAQAIYDLARSGNYAQLQYLYNEIENCSAVFSVCVTRRCSALSELDWQVVRSDERLNRNADANLVKEQIECIETAMARIDNLPEALEHFALAAFRGFSVASVWKDAHGMPEHLECLDHWNICHDHRNDRWLWNRDAVSYLNPTMGQTQMRTIEGDESIVVARKRQIDWPALKIFLRESIGERDWGRFLETYGLPPVILTMPDLASDADKEAYVEAAAAVFEGRSGVVPYGTVVDFASESRGVNPFTDFIEHQMKLFVLLATGGTLTSLAESGAGTLAGNAQMDVWKQIVRADVRIVSNCINKQLCENIIKSQKDFRGKPILAEFRLDPNPRMTADEILDLAGKAASAGFELDEKELSQRCGFAIRKKQEPAGGGFGFNAVVPVLQDKPLTVRTNSGEDAPGGGESPQNAPKPPSVAPVGADGTGAGVKPPKAAEAKETSASKKPGGGAPDSAGEKLVRSLQHDFKNVADEIAKILSMPGSDRAAAARKLSEKLDTLVPDDPAMAEVIEEQMRAAFKEQVSREPEGDAPDANGAIPN